MLFRALSVVCVFGLATWAFAAEPYDPYAVVREDPPIGPDGKLNWPAFFKSAAMEAKFQGYFATGSCVGTKMSIVNKLKDNKVDVNKLPEVEVTLKAVGSQKGAVSAVDQSGTTYMLLVHPKGVSKVSVTGPMSKDDLQVGMTVRCIIEGPGENHAASRINAMRVVSAADVLEAGRDGAREGVVYGPIMRRTARAITVKNLALKKPVTLEFASDIKIDRDADLLELVKAGDRIEAKGLVYSGVGSAAANTLFASHITVNAAGDAVASKE